MMYKCLLQPWVQRLVAIALAATSFMLVWSEATIGFAKNPDLSPFSHVSNLLCPWVDIMPDTTTTSFLILSANYARN